MEIAVVVSTFERPGLLTRCLASLAAQRGVEGRFEVVVTDDGSQDETRRLRADAIRSLPYPLSLLTSRSSVGRCVRKCHWPGYPHPHAPLSILCSFILAVGVAAAPASSMMREYPWAASAPATALLARLPHSTYNAFNAC